MTITKQVLTKGGGIATKKICKKSGNKIIHTKHTIRLARNSCNKANKTRLRFYLCEYCHYYHLTSMIGTKKFIEDEEAPYRERNKQRGKRGYREEADDE